MILDPTLPGIHLVNAMGEMDDCPLKLRDIRLKSTQSGNDIVNTLVHSIQLLIELSHIFENDIKLFSHMFLI
ncbi:hypothetical protein [Rhodospirillum sp. A1_3_36]|uniref:hypothetical protein n=1 Tax=Rhodospirillum sp. A1_3_36 TaxID=3391666 RepID=UPI0039A77E51